VMYLHFLVSTRLCRTSEQRLLPSHSDIGHFQISYALSSYSYSGLSDELCPPEHMRILRDTALKARFKVMHTVPSGTHNVRTGIPPTSYLVNNTTERKTMDRN